MESIIIPFYKQETKIQKNFPRDRGGDYSQSGCPGSEFYVLYTTFYQDIYIDVYMLPNSVSILNFLLIENCDFEKRFAEYK